MLHINDTKINKIRTKYREVFSLVLLAQQPWGERRKRNRSENKNDGKHRNVKQ